MQNAKWRGDHARLSFIPHPSSLILHPSSFIPHPSSLIPLMSAYLGIDIGTSGTKTLAIDEQGK
ncbi:MAG: hypothetical protein ACREHD_11090, partial [Pirellulales bacterium]